MLIFPRTAVIARSELSAIVHRDAITAAQRGKFRRRSERNPRMDGARTFHRDSLATAGYTRVQAGMVIRYFVKLVARCFESLEQTLA